MSSVGQSHRFPWVVAAAAAAPAALLCAVGGAVGLDSVPGAIAAGLGVVYLLVDLALVQPRLEARALQPGSLETAAEAFLSRAMDAELVDEVAAELRRAAVDGLGASRAVLVVPDPAGGIRVVSSNPADLVGDIGDPSDAFLWLGDSAEPLTSDQLAMLDQVEGARQTRELMARFGADVLLPLRHRGLLLGLALIGPPERPVAGDLGAFYRTLRTYATAAVANTFLVAEARGRSGASETLGLANAIQESLMPEDRPIRRPSFELRGLFRPVADCGGDLWMWRELDADRVLIVIADATGHGAAPALLSAVAKGTIEAYSQLAGPALEPADLLAALNRAVFRVGQRHYMMSAFAAVVDTKAEMVTYANAAQNFPLLVSGERIEALVLRGNPLGADPSSRYDTRRRPISAGDKLLLYTDGVVEAGAPEVEAFGERRFRHLIAELASSSAARIPGAIHDAVLNFLGGARVSDDITIVAFELSRLEEEA